MPWRALRPVVLFVLLSSAAPAYSVLTHEAIIDSAWDRNVKPLLLKRFPNATPDDLLNAHAYAYGGCIIQDLGYYPFGSKFFSDLTHYVRSGDFIENLIRESQNLNEYAFALGALAHYAADNEGHSIAVNHVVPMLYPKLERRYGRIVTYAENPAAHMKVEFGFDVLQVAEGHYAPKAYHDFIGFKVAKDCLDRAFVDTYDLKLKDVFRSLDLAIGTYRHAVSGLIPEMTKVAWNMKKDDLMKATPGLTRRKFIYNISRASYEKEWDRTYETPGIGAKVLAFVFRIIPKVGPFRSVSFRPATPQAAKLFEESFNKALDLYRSLLAQAGTNQLALKNTDFDTGRPTAPTEYPLCDDTYAKLIQKLDARDFSDTTPDLRENILSFYKNLNAPYANKPKEEDWDKTETAVDALRVYELESADRAVTTER